MFLSFKKLQTMGFKVAVGGDGVDIFYDGHVDTAKINLSQFGLTKAQELMLLDNLIGEVIKLQIVNALD